MARLFVFGREDKDNIGYSGDHPYSFFSYLSMKKRGIILHDYSLWYICKAQPAYTYMEERYVLRPRETRRDKKITCSITMSLHHKEELVNIIDRRNREGYHAYINPHIYRSVEKYRVHLCKAKILDSIK